MEMQKMSNREMKPKRTSEELVVMMRDEKGICFEAMCEEEAVKYLKQRNNYMRTAAYRKNYEKHRTGKQKGKYIQLDFKDLVVLSAIDKELRVKLLEMCIDVEHAIQVHLLQELEHNDEEDGYQIVADFLQENPHIQENILRARNGVYTKKLFKKYFQIEQVGMSHGYPLWRISSIDCPVWVLLELLTFGDLLKFFDYYRQRFPQKTQIPRNLLNMVKSLRNACAHNNCLLVSLAPDRKTRPPRILSQYASQVLDISTGERAKKLSNRPLLEMTCLSYVYHQLVSDEAKQRMQEEWERIADDWLRPMLPMFEKNSLVYTSLGYILKLIQHI